MKNYTNETKLSPQENQDFSQLEEILREGARKMMQQAIELEVSEFLTRNNSLDEKGHLLAVKNGYLPERNLLTGIGPLTLKQPRIDDRKLKERNLNGFSSSILPRYMRRVPSLDTLIPWLYLKGISTGDFQSALSGILGKNASGLSAANIVRLKKSWEDDYTQWGHRDLSQKDFVYFWVDGIHFNIRLEEDRACILVIIGADKDGNKELIAVQDGYRESKENWKSLLFDLRNKQNLLVDPKLVVGDGALGFWAAAEEMLPSTKGQRCWVHKTANILDKLPKRIQGKAKSEIHEMYMAPSKKEALREFNNFVEKYQDKYPKAVTCLTKDKDRLFSFYDFPAKHWQHIRSTNPIESTDVTPKRWTFF